MSGIPLFRRNAQRGCRCVASCTAHIQELTEPEDRLRNLGERFSVKRFNWKLTLKRTTLGKYRQFRFLVGAPDKEKKFLSALPRGDHPTVFASTNHPLSRSILLTTSIDQAFHGSPLKNWHSVSHVSSTSFELSRLSAG